MRSNFPRQIVLCCASRAAELKKGCGGRPLRKSWISGFKVCLLLHVLWCTQLVNFESFFGGMLDLKRDKDVIKQLVAQRWGYLPHLEVCGVQKLTIFLQLKSCIYHHQIYHHLVHVDHHLQSNMQWTVREEVSFQFALIRFAIFFLYPRYACQCPIKCRNLSTDQILKKAEQEKKTRL